MWGEFWKKFLRCYMKLARNKFNEIMEYTNKTCQNWVNTATDSVLEWLCIFMLLNRNVWLFIYLYLKMWKTAMRNMNSTFNMSVGEWNDENLLWYREITILAYLERSNINLKYVNFWR